MLGAVLMLAGLAVSAAGVRAEEARVVMHRVTAEGTGASVGEVVLRDSPYGLLATPHLAGLAPGPHAMHVHEKPDCGPLAKGGKVVPGGAAGGHYDPERTGLHEGPYGNGHLGDLPVIIVDQDGRAEIAVLAPRLTLDDVRGHSLVIHAGSDTYSDHPHRNGGGGARMYCGLIR